MSMTAAMSCVTAAESRRVERAVAEDAQQLAVVDQPPLGVAADPHGARPALPVALEVHDTGCGIAAENIEFVFEPFWQAEQTATDQKEIAQQQRDRPRRPR